MYQPHDVDNVVGQKDSDKDDDPQDQKQDSIVQHCVW
jgi:hypothetical protein